MVKKTYFRIEYLYLFWLVLLSARASNFTSNIDPRINFIGFIITICPCIYFFYKYRIQLSTQLLIALVVLLAWTVLHAFYDKTFKILQYIIIYINLLSAYVVVNIFKKKIYHYFCNIVCFLTFIDVILWGLMHIVGSHTLASIAPFDSSSGTSFASFLLFNVTNTDLYSNYWVFERNCGFCWEPGLFACFIVLAIFINLMETNYRIKNNRKLFILLIGLITTFSTTGYSSLLVLFACRYLFMSAKKISFSSIFSSVLLFCAGYFIWGLSFIGAKIQTSADDDFFLTENKVVLDYYAQRGENKTVDRLEGIVLDYYNWSEAPILGYGIRENSYVRNRISEYIFISNDLMNLFARYGLILGLLYHFYMIKTSRRLRIDNGELNNSLYVLYLSISVSYPFSWFSMIMAITLYEFLDNKNFKSNFIKIA